MGEWRSVIDTADFPEFVTLPQGQTTCEQAYPIVGETYDEENVFTAVGFSPYVSNQLSEVIGEDLIFQRLVGSLQLTGPIWPPSGEIVQTYKCRIGFIVGQYNDNLTTTSLFNPYDEDRPWLYRRDFIFCNNTALNTQHSRDLSQCIDVELDVKMNRVIVDDDVLFFHIGFQHYFGASFDGDLYFHFHARWRAYVQPVTR